MKNAEDSFSISAGIDVYVRTFVRIVIDEVDRYKFSPFFGRESCPLDSSRVTETYRSRVEHYEIMKKLSHRFSDNRNVCRFVITTI